MIPLRLYLILGTAAACLALVGYVYLKGRSDGAETIITKSLVEERRVVETASKARLDADMRNAVGDGLRLNDGYRRD